MSDDLQRLSQAGVLAALDLHFARAMGQLSPGEPDSVLLGAALASRAVRHGHVCADLRQIISQVPLDADGRPVREFAWPGHAAWTLELSASPLVSAGERPTPLVFDGGARLYLARYFGYQRRLIETLRRRIADRDETVDPRVLGDGLARLFGDAPADSSDAQQRLAAVVAVLHRFAVISGGPGTGKTTTVVRILALLIEQALASGAPPPRIVLLAPTGKAAARLGESINAQVERLDCTDPVKGAIVRTASTIHRGLGYRPGSPTRFRHDAGHPLPADIVLVDEASMVDLALMAKLLDAVDDQTRVILLGDMNQLASVEAGAILGDICNRGGAREISGPLADRLAALGDPAILVPTASSDAAPIADHIVELTHSFRFSAQGGIGALARAIGTGDAPAVRDALGPAISPAEAATTDREVALVAMRDDDDPAAILGPVVADGLRPYLAAADPAGRLEALGRFRVLCAHRRGSWGVERVGAAIERVLAHRAGLRTDDAFYDGRPVLVTKNDYQVDLYNGDVGVIVADASGRRRVWFPSADGLRGLSPSRLPPHETVFAMTVHKSQGSEFDRVILLVPPAVSPILTRELVYTAVTRAKKQVLVFGDPGVLHDAVSRRIDRASGLREALWDR
jgi:exodeoxyribonuclease V alpha subunit